MLCVFFWMFFLSNFRKNCFLAIYCWKIQLYFNAESNSKSRKKYLSCYFHSFQNIPKFIFIFYYYFALIGRKSLQQFHFILQYFIFLLLFFLVFDIAVELLLLLLLLKILKIILYFSSIFPSDTHESSLYNRNKNKKLLFVTH